VACPQQHHILTGGNQAHQALEDQYCLLHSAGARDIDMVFREVENLKALTHPNIVKIINCYTLSNMQLVVVMEYLPGGELLNLLKIKGKFT
jgi:MAP/microtubule affinity-regulating kinase